MKKNRDCLHLVQPVQTRCQRSLSEKMDRNFSVLHLPEETLKVFEPIFTVLRNSAVEKDTAKLMFTMGSHSLFVPAPRTKAQYFEATALLSSEMQEQLQRILEESSQYDGVKRKCHRALANHYSTECNGSSRSFVPMLAPHRDDVGQADISIVLGITPTTEFRGCRLFVSTERKGHIWMNTPEQPSRRSVIGVDVCRGKCVILRNAVMHYVSLIQRGARQSVVFHMKQVL